MLKKTISALFFIVFFTIPVQSAFARWASVEDTDISMEIFNKNIEIHKDGSFIETTELLMNAIKESGKDRLVSLPLTYNTNNSQLKILEAKTIYNGKEYPVDLSLIEDKPLASTPQGFDQNNQILIAFPQMALNAKVYLKYQHIVTEPPIPGFFSTDFIYGIGQYEKTSRVHLTSEIPFYVKTWDKDNLLAIKQYQENNRYQLDIVLKKPIIKLPIDEQFSVFDSKMYPWVTISTLKEWPKLGAKVVSDYEAVINQNLPELFEKIAIEAKTKPTTIEKINAVTAQLSENVTYMGDWRTIKGSFIPRNLNEIVKSKFGDCKDFSAVTTAILRRMGMKADVALVKRGIEYYETPNDLPNLYAFNHAFVRVQEGSKTYWIDPTNFTSFAQGIYPDIADRESLVLDPTAPILSRTPPLKAEDSEITIRKRVVLPNNPLDMANVTGEIKMTGALALPLIGADLKASKDSINLDIIRAVADESRTITWKVSDYDLKSRIAQNLNFNFDFTEKHSQMKTTAGNAFVLHTPLLIAKLLTKTNDRVTGLHLEVPSKYRYEILLSKASLIGKTLSNCSVDSPWFKGSRKITDTPEGIRVLDEMIIKRDKITNAELNSKEYSQFQNSVYECFGATGLIYKSH